MRIAPVNQQSFKGLWEVKEKDFNVAGLGNVWDVSYIYHPFSDESVEGKEESLRAKVPETFIHTPDAELLRTMYCTSFELGERLETTEGEFLEDKRKVLNSLDGHYAETTEELPAQKFYNYDDTEKILRENEEFCRKMEEKDPGCCKRAYDELMKNN